ncbi:MAG: DNA mismatch repair endonuclease MutL [Deltaproteobacteria bacterium]|nr:DNA mismatch repair endonuclease MutL [Deltaproteobacteria bacterium]MBW2014453.1 DNA mismatch repair endonuclease MutL [Deltaproteobacteria bacterium]MBW2090247.1 DNA mismatch repair endonuclease MutL [Deltaproteobacteria bacterium]
MSKIKILPEILSNKIAAGEVVERPASVVKELVENALDADSTRIIIEVEKGGRSLIRVSDNGMGMNRDDALLAPERYATSKIYKDEDLFAIHTLGFRGEALPSIAAVSKFCLVTRDRTSQAGTEVVVEGGTIKKVSQIGAPLGTMVTVSQLFFNTPARRKFLKTVNTEMGHIADTVSNMALGHPDIQFRLIHNGKVVKNLSATADNVGRVVDVLGKDIKNNLYKIEFTSDFLTVQGWISSPRITRSTSRGIYLYVNRRFVRNRVIQHALFQGYGSRLMKGQFPVAVIFIHVPCDQLDVNVHPTKHEVKFAQQKKIHDAVTGIVAERLRVADQPEWRPKRFPEPEPVDAKSRISESVPDFSIPKKQIPTRYTRTNGISASLRPATRTRQAVTDIPAEAGSPQKPDLRFTPTSGQTELWARKRFGDLKVIGQFHDTYILCESSERMVLIDQHAAHERILFEQLKNQSQASKKTSQKLLIPETIDLGYREAKILEGLIPDLNELGLEIEPFGGNTFVVKSVPALLENKEVKPLVMEMVEKMAQIGFSPGLEKAMDQCLILMACHGAIRANQKLSEQEIKGLLDQLDQCDEPSNCPHGRPTWITWSIKDLEKSFKRIV